MRKSFRSLEHLGRSRNRVMQEGATGRRGGLPRPSPVGRGKRSTEQLGRYPSNAFLNLGLLGPAGHHLGDVAVLQLLMVGDMLAAGLDNGTAPNSTIWHFASSVRL